MSTAPTPLNEALNGYDRSASRTEVVEADEERRTVTSRYPLEQWPTLPLDRYALGLGDNEKSFCWWIEFGTPHVGSIRGGSARKHIIYRKNDGDWYYDHDEFANEQRAWEAVRAGFVKAFERAKAGDWDAIDDVEEIRSGPALRTKVLHCYFPTELLPICSIAHLRHFLRLVGKPEDAAGYNNNVVRLNRLLLHALRNRSEFSGWSTKEIERFLYHWADPGDQTVVVKVAPGENAEYWDECVRAGIISVGWDDIGDLRQFQSKDAFDAKFREVFSEFYKNHGPTITRKGKEVWTFRNLKPGDLVVANKGTSRVKGVGEVIEPGYEYRPERPIHRHVVHVKWDASYEQDIPPQKQWAFQTVAPVTQKLSAQILSNQSDGATNIKAALPVDPLFSEMASALDRKGQVVLYGPPGTGKTFSARKFAVWWLNRQSGTDSPDILTDPESFAQAEQKLSTSQVVRRVWWVVANPKEWSWDRLFKEKRVSYRYGRLQRNYPLVRKGDLVVGYQTMPDKRIVALATIGRELYTAKDGEPRIELEPLVRIDDGPTYDQLQEDPTLRDSEPMRFRCQGTLFALAEDEFDQLSAMLTEQQPDLRPHLEGHNGVGPLTRLTFHPSYSYEDFIEGFRPVEAKGGQLSLRLEDGIFKRVCREAQANPSRPYLVLIDEINRANVAKVFGELITLLEVDKRGLLVSLPQSKQPFTIPPNVYILGTMNTADRSIKLLDAALRRRFAFLELMPDSNLLSGGKIGNLALDDFLDELNRRIAAKEGREKQIGHSFLLEGEQPVSEPDEFARRFRQEILPLLQEYCYDDYRVLADYIGDKLVNREAQTLDEERLADPERLVESLEEAFAKAGKAP